MNNKSKNKGFTLVELLVVIAILAVLAAVSVIGYLGFTEKAKESADEQAVTQINTLLKANGVEEKPKYVSDVVEMLLVNGLDVDEYKPLSANKQFYWVESLNIVVYSDENNKVLFPDEHKNLVYQTGDWYSLNAKIDVDDNWNEKVSGDTLQISNASTYAGFVEEFNESKNINGISKVTLNSDIDFMGASSKIKGQGTGSNVTGLSSDLTIEGNNHTIYNYRDDNETFMGSGDYAAKGYAFGMISKINKDVTVTIKNVTIDGFCIDDTLADSGISGIIAGYVYGNLVLENVTFRNCCVRSGQKVGGIAGWIEDSGSLTLRNVKFEDILIEGYCEVGGIAGVVYARRNNIDTMENNLEEKIKTADVDLSGITYNYVDPESSGIQTEFANQNIELNINATIKGTNYKYTKKVERTLNGIYTIYDNFVMAGYSKFFNVGYKFEVNQNEFVDSDGHSYGDSSKYVEVFESGNTIINGTNYQINGVWDCIDSF